jgi:hypothetical protein
MKQQNYRIRNMAISGALGLILSACGTNPVQQVQKQQQDDYRVQAKVAKQAISEAPDWMSKLPKESGVIYENGTAISSDFSMADLKAKTMAYVKICTGAGGKVRSQMKIYRADNDGASIEQSELTARSICPDVDITGVETVEMKHVAEGNRIRTYVLVALPMGSKNEMKSTKDLKNRSGDAFKDLDQVVKDQKAVERRLLGEGARDLVFTAKHQEEVDYGKVLAEDWRFDSDGTTMFSGQATATTTSVFAKKSEYLCLGFPQKVIECIQAEVNDHLNKTPNAVLRVERILLDRLSRISTRKEYQRLSKSTIRQAFKINRKALDKAQLLWPEIFKYK